jgi:serine protease Do
MQGMTPLEEFFRQFMDEYQSRPRKTSSLGSGFLIDQKDSTAYVVTCYHVIADADEIKVTLNDGRQFKAEVVGKNRRTDLAVLKFTSKEKLVIAQWGDSSQSRVGDWVIAVGNPFGLSSTVTSGIISTVARDIGGRSRGLGSSIVDGFLQTDASINMGNSGGPMFNIDGKVIGINTSIFSPNGGNIGIGFAIPSVLAKSVVSDLMTRGYAMSGWLGVKIQEISEDVAESMGLKNTQGALVGEITPQSPAEKAGIAMGDIILKFDNVTIKESKVLPMLVAKSKVGDTLPIVVLREGKELTLQITVGNFDAAEKEGPILAFAYQALFAPFHHHC